MSTYSRQAITAAMVQVRFSGAIPGNFADLNKSYGYDGDSPVIRETIARCQNITTTDQMPYARVKQLGYGTIVEDVPLFIESSGQLSVIETIDIPSLYKLGIADFVGYLKSCVRKPLDIVLLADCAGPVSSNFSGPRQGGKSIDEITNVKFTTVARAIDVGSMLVSNNAAFIFIRTLIPPVG